MATEESIQVLETPHRGEFRLYIPGNGPDPATIKVTDIAGRQIKELTAPSGQHFDLTLDVAEGLYTLSISTASENFTTRIRVEK